MKRKFLLPRIGKAFLVAAAHFSCISMVQAQHVLTQQTTYTQNFNGLPDANGNYSWSNNSTLTGWYASNNNGPITAIRAGGGGVVATGLRNYGVDGDPERAFGVSTDAATGTHYYGLRIKNNTGDVIRNFTVTYTLEQWYRNGQPGVLTFSYQKGKTVTNLTNGTWTSVGALTAAQTLTLTPFGPINGNSTGNRKTVTSMIKDIDLPSGEEIMFRWQDTDDANNAVLLGIDDVTITPSGKTDIFYDKATAANVIDQSSWGMNADGSGTAPASNSRSFQTFVLKNNANPVLGSSLTIDGTGSKMVVGDGYTPINFTIPANHSYTGIIDVKNNATLTLNNPTMPTIGTLANNSTVAYQSSTPQNLQGNSYGNLVVGSSDMTLSDHTVVKQSLQLSNANLVLGHYDLTLENGATIAGANENAYVQTAGYGSLKMQVNNNNTDVIFPVGTSEYTPVKIRQASTAIPDVFSVRTVDGLYQNYIYDEPDGSPIATEGVNKTWILDEEVNGGSDITLTVQWPNTQNLSDFDATKARLLHFTDGGWDNTPVATATSSGTNYELSRSGITSFSPFGVFTNDPPMPLPVELVSFEARRTENAIVCNWKTAQELNNNYFTVERSTNGTAFEKIGEVKGKGTTAQASRYEFTDSNAPASLTYYRLRQTDFDGTASYSKVIAVAGNGNKAVDFVVYPNPAGGVRNLQTLGLLSEAAQVTVINSLGKVLKQTEVSPEVLQQGYTIDLAGEGKGIYFIKVRTNQEVKTLRILQQ